MNDRKERITRALRLNAADIRDGQTAVAEFGESLPTHLDIQLEQICAVGARSHISSSSINKWPKFTEIVKAAGPASHRALGAWRVCSGLAHGKRWPTLTFLKHTMVGEDPTTGAAHIETTSDADRDLWALDIAVTVARRARGLHLQRAQ